MLLLDLLLFAVGLALLVVGAEGLVRGGSRLAISLRVPALVVGLTVVAFGTSAPEFVVSTTAALQGTTDIAVGNVVGSNIVNILLIAGLSALFTPLLVQDTVVRREVPILIGITMLLLVVSLDGGVSRLEGALFLAGLVAYTGFAYVLGRRQHRVGEDFPAAEVSREVTGSRLVNVLLVLGGLALLVVGGRLLVGAAVSLASDLGVSDRIIGLTIVAAGTSMPELATSVVAALRKQTDIAVGNVVGSNVMNILGILGSSALILPLPVSAQMLRVDMGVMLLAALALLPVVLTHHRISRWEGAVLVSGYVGYTTYLVVTA
ncbi:MAG TPA: calcium/sodium antiporter [Candidatus Thermoplasmatota archaeon]|nr:calcium/sodium antiporter [Candidatus Thermoplasmatota archaeon]